MRRISEYLCGKHKEAMWLCSPLVQLKFVQRSPSVGHPDSAEQILVAFMTASRETGGGGGVMKSAEVVLKLVSDEKGTWATAWESKVNIRTASILTASTILVKCNAARKQEDISYPILCYTWSMLTMVNVLQFFMWPGINVDHSLPPLERENFQKHHLSDIRVGQP